MTNKIEISRELLQYALNSVEYLALRTDDIGASNVSMAEELRALLAADPYECLDGGKCGNGGYCDACPHTKPAAQHGTVAETAILIIRDICEQEPDDAPESVHISIKALELILIDHLGELIAAPVVERQDVQVAAMPVERCYDVRVKMIMAFNKAKKNGGDLDDSLDAAYKSALRFSQTHCSPSSPRRYRWC